MAHPSKFELEQRMLYRISKVVFIFLIILVTILSGALGFAFYEDQAPREIVLGHKIICRNGHIAFNERSWITDGDRRDACGGVASNAERVEQVKETVGDQNKAIRYGVFMLIGSTIVGIVLLLIIRKIFLYIWLGPKILKH